MKLTRIALKNCEFYAEGKGKQNNVAKKSKHGKADVPGKRIFMDIKSMREPKDKRATPYVANPNMMMLVDEYSECGFILWFDKKSSMVKPTAALFHE